jgi:hypothetical protein
LTTLLLLVLATGLAPLMIGMLRLRRAAAGPPAQIGSILLCVLAFNLTFFWQELWLVVPKALTPGLHPILYHNDHDWSGQAPTVELLQGTGALATLIIGLVSCAALAMWRGGSVTLRLFLFWMGFQGLFQALSQLAIGTLLPGNDMGRALTYLQAGSVAKAALLVLAVAGMFLAGAWLARLCPSDLGLNAGGRTRAFGYGMLIVTMASIVLIIPFRLPRPIVEVALIPRVVNLVGVGWLILGAGITGPDARGLAEGRPGLFGPALALAVMLPVFQLVLRPGVAF